MKVIKFAPGLIPVLKHGTHDQKTHGSWATGTDGLSVTRDQSSFEQKLVLQNKKGEMLAYVQFQDHRDSVDILFIRSYDSGKGYATRLIEALYSSIPDKEIYWGKTSVPESTHLAQKFSDKYGRTQFMPWAEGAIAGYEWGELYGDTTVKKHAMHDQKTHGNWARGGNGLGIEEAMALIKRSDPLKKKVYDAENSLVTKKEKTKRPDHPKIDDFPSREEYDKAYKEYSKKWMAWVVDEQANIVSKTGAELLDGTPAGVKKYVEKIIQEDWFIEAFGDGSSLPKLEVKVGNMSAAGRHIMSFQRERATGRIVKTRHELALERQFTKDERAILHEIAHYATAINQTEKYDAHGVEFVRNNVFIVGKVAGSASAEALENAYQEKGVRDGD